MSDKEFQGFEGKLSPAQMGAIKAFAQERRLDTSEQGLRRLANMALAGVATQAAVSRYVDAPARVTAQSWALLDSPEPGFAAWG